MPYIPNAPDDEQQPGQGAIAPGAGGIRTSPGGIGNAPSAGAPPPKDAGGQFATLQSYLTANQGQAAPLANKITSGIQGQYDTLGGQNASTLSGIQGQVAQGYTPQNQDILAQEAANPVSFASNAGNVQSFQKQLADQFTGPTSAESTPDYQKQQSAINNAIATGTAQTGSEAGREQLLQQNEARPTTGVTALNSAILTQSPDYLGQVQNAYKPFSNLLSGLSSGASDVNAQIAKNTAEAQDTSQKANAQIASQSQKLQSDLNTNLASATDQTNKYNSGLQDWQTGVAANQPFNAALGSSNLLSLLNLQNPFSGNYSAINAPTLPQVATQDQYATDQALKTLAGTGYNPTFNPSDAAQIGKFSAPGTLPAAPDIAKLMDDIAAADIKNYTGGNGVAPIPVTPGLLGSTTLGGAQSAMLQGFAPNQFSNYQTQVLPFQNLMAALRQIYGDQYTTPALVGGKPIPGQYLLKS